MKIVTLMYDPKKGPDRPFVLRVDECGPDVSGATLTVSNAQNREAVERMGRKWVELEEEVKGLRLVDGDTPIPELLAALAQRYKGRGAPAKPYLTTTGGAIYLDRIGARNALGEYFRTGPAPSLGQLDPTRERKSTPPFSTSRPKR